ncbi:MAG: CAP domain-containing protein [Anaerolineae bacterium]|nr:CAP domain-containing protein [Anaerolineae bacterium]
MAIRVRTVIVVMAVVVAGLLGCGRLAEKPLATPPPTDTPTSTLTATPAATSTATPSETRGQGDKETRGRGDTETRRPGDKKESPTLPLPSSPSLLVTDTPTPEPLPTDTPLPPAETATAALPAPTVTAASAPADGPTDPALAALAAMINQARGEAGLDELAWSLELAQAAAAHARDMGEHGFVSHTGSDGSGVATRMERAGYRPTWHGEIIACVAGGYQKAFEWWWNSRLHHDTMLGTAYRDFGLGSAPARIGQACFVVLFGRR